MKPIVALALVFLGCSSAARSPAPSEYSTEVCGHYRRLGCEAAAPTPDGTPCEQVVDDMAFSGIPTHDLQCCERARSCDALDAC